MLGPMSTSNDLMWIFLCDELWIGHLVMIDMGDDPSLNEALLQASDEFELLVRRW